MYNIAKMAKKGLSREGKARLRFNITSGLFSASILIVALILLDPAGCVLVGIALFLSNIFGLYIWGLGSTRAEQAGNPVEVRQEDDPVRAKYFDDLKSFRTTVLRYLDTLIADGQIDRLVDMAGCNTSLFLKAIEDISDGSFSTKSVTFFAELTTTRQVDLRLIEHDINIHVGDQRNRLSSAIENNLVKESSNEANQVHKTNSADCASPDGCRLPPLPDGSVKVYLVQPAAFLRLRTFMLNSGFSPADIRDSDNLLHDSIDLVTFMVQERI